MLLSLRVPIFPILRKEVYRMVGSFDRTEPLYDVYVRRKYRIVRFKNEMWQTVIEESDYNKCFDYVPEE
jgi:hypothetical protein